ncbi:MAG TPA: GTPase Era [Thermoclostridium caenicola]|uniref:GTPase Era n=1 Tax=Thermoclostridium caenicola TaxID=659425 RepID=UPI002BD1C572|nr:GTPase Era [Thermoclostridium caenicola]HOK43679.1 GTPase Era [Thermoclostridium caenicola]HOL85292.1 GTPase Era [Thermoclostridium caenicola]HPO76525.1 GTPase Era [Thermoclostridium caenicola]
MAFKSGFITIIGRPNVGKSTLLNLLTGEKVSIISRKPQTTRHNIRTVVTREDFQMVFVDTPGIHKPKNKLGEFMMNAAMDTLDDVDIVLYMVEATEKEIGPGDQSIIAALKKVDTPVILAINKVDLVEKSSLLPLIDMYSKAHDFREIVPISATDPRTVELMFGILKKYLPEGEKLYPDDMLTDQPAKVLVQELIREKMLELLDDEVPHGVGIEVVRYNENEERNILGIDANIYCEKASHKAIIIGKGGEMLKRIGIRAREDIERLFGMKVVLKLWVKVKEDWRNSDYMLNELGYKS